MSAKTTSAQDLFGAVGWLCLFRHHQWKFLVKSIFKITWTSYLRLSSAIMKDFLTPRFSNASTAAFVCGPCTRTSITACLDVEIGKAIRQRDKKTGKQPPTDADVAQTLRSSSANSFGSMKKDSRPHIRVTVFRPCRFSRTIWILGTFPFLFSIQSVSGSSYLTWLSFPLVIL